MAHSSENLHIYRREIKPGEQTSLSVLAGLVGEGAKVLDLGTGSGALGRYLQAQSCIVDGVTINEAEANLARSGYRRLEIADLDHCDLPQMFAGERYDAIICADVLEHLKYPEKVVEACRQLLLPQGRLLISVPNAAYCGLIGELLQGEFRYRQEGLLDQTHLRFFTRRSLTRFLAELGWSADAIAPVRLDLISSEFRVAFDGLPPAVARYLLSVPDALTYQLVVTARPQLPGQLAVDNVGSDPVGGQALFSAQLYVASNGGFSEDQKILATGVIGQVRQVLRFGLAAAGADAVTGLRLDLADRPGFLHLYRVSLSDAQGRVVWQWRSDVDDLSVLEQSAHHELLLRPPWATSPAALLLLHGDDPWLELPVPEETLTGLGDGTGCVLDVEMGWPMSADYLALSDQVKPLVERVHQVEQDAARERLALEQDAARQLQQMAQEAAAQRHEQERLAAMAEQEAVVQREQAERRRLALQEEAERQRSAREQVVSELAKVEEQNRLLAEQNRSLFEQKITFFKEKSSLQAERFQLQRDRDGLIQHLEWIENSTIFRATRPLVKLKMGVGRLLKGPEAPVPAQPEGPAPAPSQAALETGAMTVDIIVPVYKGLSDTQCCIESVLNSRCRTPYRLVVINDASPEAEVTDWLRERAVQDDRIMLLENAENLGFVGTVNRGMALSDAHDVLLLNSDAEVANDWLDRLRVAAYGDDRVASVTPFSNNATICSYPRFCQDNALPPGQTTATLDALFSHANAGQVVDVPTGVGFCMYIRRDCLRDVGLFDTDHFGKGYGEENDFCRRASDAGWRNLHALDTFVRHAGGVSFGASKSPREREAMETLRRLHPDYEALVHRFVSVDPAQAARQRVQMARVKSSGLPVVLAIVHDRSGGTVRHVAELAVHMQAQAVFFVLKPLGGGFVSLDFVGTDESLQLAFKLPEEYDDLVQCLRDLGVQHVHFHHLIGHDDLVRALPARLGLPYDFTAHDYYMLCPQISLTDHTNGYCGEKGLDQCRSCLRRSPAPGGIDIETWRWHHADFVVRARHVLVPSLDAARRFAMFATTADIRLAPHTDTAGPAALPVPSPRVLEEMEPLKVVVIGAISSIKGADVLEDVAVEAARRGAPVEFHLIGYAYRSLRTQPKASLTVHGEYAEQELPRLLAWLKPDLIWFPAQWPETYSYTLSAALQNGMPVVAPDLGAFAERLNGRPWSWIKPWNTTPMAWLSFFLELRQDHFVTGKGPEVQTFMHQLGVDTLVKPWSYHTDYLKGVHVAANPPMLSPAFIAAHRPGRGDGGVTSPQRMKQGLLTVLIRLRSAKGLRNVARAIPLRWQTRLKSWLRA